MLPIASLNERPICAGVSLFFVRSGRDMLLYDDVLARPEDERQAYQEKQPT